MKSVIFSGLIFLTFAHSIPDTLFSTKLSLEAIYQHTSTSPIEKISIPKTVTISEPAIEFPSVAKLEIDNLVYDFNLIDVSINAANNFIEIDFDNVSSQGGFSPAYENTYVFTFHRTPPLVITGANIDATTTLGLSNSDVTFSANQLRINVENLPFNPTTYARINLITH